MTESVFLNLSSVSVDREISGHTQEGQRPPDDVPLQCNAISSDINQSASAEEELSSQEDGSQTQEEEGEIKTEKTGRMDP